MDVREKLVELLGGVQDYGFCRSTKEEPQCKVINSIVADHLIAHGVTVQDSKGVEIDQFNKWISVKDRLPEKDKLVLCIGKRGGMFLGEIHPFLVGRERNEVYCDVPNSRQGRYAIYWMPLPQPPKGE